MSSKILIKRSTTSGAIPTTSDLDTGELGLNTVDKRLYTNNSGTIVELGTYPSSLNVTGNTDLDGTLNVDGASTLAPGTVSGNWTVTGTLTVSTPTNSTDAASKGYVDTAVANVIDSAPGALDTLNELAAAINDDANFATTITNSIATKLALAGGTMTGAIDRGSNKITTTYTPTDNADLTTKTYVDGILGSATDAATSAAAAATSAASAATSATNASTSATASASSATSSASSATDAATSATAASSSATSATNSATSSSTYATNSATSATAAAASAAAAAASATDAAASATEAAGYIPDNTGQSGKYLTTDGSTNSWAAVDALPSQSGQSGNYLTTDGSTASWAALDTDANTTTKGLYEHANTISANYSITSGNNALSSGAMIIDSGVSVTVPTGSTWTIV